MDEAHTLNRFAKYRYHFKRNLVSVAFPVCTALVIYADWKKTQKFKAEKALKAAKAKETITSCKYIYHNYCSPASGGVILVLSCDMTNCIIFHIFHFFLASVASMCIHFCTIMYYVYLYRYVSL